MNLLSNNLFDTSSYYAIKTPIHSEERLCSILKALIETNYIGTYKPMIFVPLYERIISNKPFISAKRALFPGSIFIENETAKIIFDVIKRYPEILVHVQKFIPLSGTDISTISTLYKKRGQLDILTANFDKNGRILVNGFLNDIPHTITKVHKHNRYLCAQIPFLKKNFNVYFSFHFAIR